MAYTRANELVKSPFANFFACTIWKEANKNADWTMLVSMDWTMLDYVILSNLFRLLW